MSRDHLKTSLLTIAGNIQRIFCNPTIRILLASDKAEAAEGQLAEIKGHLVNPLLIWLFPEILFNDPYREAYEWSNSAISVKRKRETREATIETIGVEGASTGKHYDHGQFDDLVDEQNCKTRDLLEKTINWYRTSQSLFEPEATQEIPGTPWEFGDLYDYLVRAKLTAGFKLGIYRQPCWRIQEPGTLRVDKYGGIAADAWLLDADGNKLPIYPEKHSRESLLERQNIPGAGRLFAAQWLLRPEDDSASIFPRTKVLIRPARLRPDATGLWCVMAVDPAASEKSWADHTAITVAGFDSSGFMHILDLRRGRWSEDRVIDEVYDAYAKTAGITTVGFETVAFQKLYMREFVRAGETRGFLPVVKLERDTKQRKNDRIRSLQPWWANQQIILYEDLPALDDFLSEAERFRPDRENASDDMLDATADCLQLRVRPIEADPDAGLDDEDRERRKFEREHPRLAGGALREAYHISRITRDWEESKERDALGVGDLDEFYN